MPSKEVAHKHR